MRVTRNGKRWAAGFMAAGALAVNLACSNQLNDLEAIPQAKPDYVITFLNVDGFPNVTMLCIDGVGFATITRDYSSLTPVPKWDPICALHRHGSPVIVGHVGTNK